MAAVGCYTLRGRCVCVFGVKCGDSCGSEDAVEQVADWHSDAGRKYRRSKCSIPDDHIDPRRSAFFMARSVLGDIREGNQC